MSDKKRVVILGVGPAGLGAAYSLSRSGYTVTVIDRAHYVGGASASFKIKDYIVDYGPHAFHIKKEEIVKLVADLIENDYNKVRRKSRLILDGKNLGYPLDIKEALFRISPLLSLRILVDYLMVRTKCIFSTHSRIQTFEDWGVEAFGHTLYRIAFGNYTEKMWGMPGSRLSSKLAQQKLLKLNLLKIVLKVLGVGDTTFEGGVTAYYDLYPRWGIGTIFEKMRDAILRDDKNEIFLDAKIIDITCRQDKLENIRFSHNGKDLTRNFDYLISTIPLSYLCEYLSLPQKATLLSFSRQLKYRDLRIIYVVLNKDYFSDIHWIYFLDPHFRFNRLSEQKNLNKESSPAGKTVISLDIACNYGDKIWNMSDEEFLELALQDLNHLGIEKERVLEHFSLKLQDAYPVYNLDFDTSVSNILKILKEYNNLYSIGRQGLFLNNDIHDSIEMGIYVSKFIADSKTSEEWYVYVEKYVKERFGGIK